MKPTSSRRKPEAKPKRGARRPKRAAKRPAARAAKRPSRPARRKRVAPARRAPRSRWLAFVAKHGVVLASARGPVPSVAEAVAGEPIVGSWWAHAKGKAIFAALGELDDSPDVRCFKLIDGKITLVHRRLWPALVRLGRDGALAPAQLISLQQEHMPTGEHRNVMTPFPEWVDEATARAADVLASAAARAALASVVDGSSRGARRARG